MASGYLFLDFIFSQSRVSFSFIHLNLKPFPRLECIKMCVPVHPHFLDKLYIIRIFYYMIVGVAWTNDAYLPFDKSSWKKGGTK